VTTEGGGVARRRVPESELVYPDSEENKRVAQVSDRLIKARLLVKGQETGEPYVEPAHDFLVRGWDKLQGWIKEEQEDLTLQHRLTPAAHDWKHGRGMLWIEEVDRLAKLEKVIESETDNWLNKLETKFVTGSIRERQDRIKKLEEDLRISEQRRARAEVREKATRVEKLVNREPLDALILTIQAIGQNLQELPGEFITSALTNLYTMTKYEKVTRRPFTFDKGADQVIFCSDNLHLGVIENGRLVHLLDLQGTDVIQPFDVQNNLIFSISPNGQYIVEGTSSRFKHHSDDGKIWLSDLRGNSVVTSFSAHKDGMAFLEFSPDSQYIVSRGGDMTVRLWDIKGNFISEPFQMYNDDLISDSSFTQPENCASRIIYFAINPNSKSIVTASLDGIIQLYNLQGEPIRDPFPERITGTFMRMVFSTDYTTIATISFIDTGNDTGLIEISSWDIEGKPINKSRLGLKDEINFPDLNLVELSPDCKYVVLGYNNGTFELRDVESTLIHAVFKGHEGSLRSVAFSPNGQMIASVSDDKTLRLWDIKGNSINQQFFDFEDQDKGEICFQTNQEKVQSLAISPDGQYIASGGYDNTVRLWDCKGNTLGKPCQVHESNPYSDSTFGIRYDGVKSVAISPDGQYIASGGYDNTVRLCNFKGDSLVELFRDWKTTVLSIAFSPNGQLIAIASGGAIHLCNIKGNPVLKPFRGEHEYPITMVAFSPDGQFFISIELHGQVFFWNLKGEQIRQPLRAEQLFPAVAFSPNSQYIVCGGLGGRVDLWDLEGNLISRFERGSQELIERSSQKYIYSVAFSPDGQYIASGSGDGTVCLSDLQGFLICPPFQGHSGKVNSVVFSPDGKYIFSGGEDGTIRRWNCWPIWLQTCCNRLQWHTVFKYPNEIKNLEQRQIAVDACKTCQNYIWNSEVGANE
jgi:WD40 repeat protein